MSETVKVGYIVLQETRKRIAQLARITHRNKSTVVDWAVELAWAKTVSQPNDIPVTEIEAATNPGDNHKE